MEDGARAFVLDAGDSVTATWADEAASCSHWTHVDAVGTRRLVARIVHPRAAIVAGWLAGMLVADPAFVYLPQVRAGFDNKASLRRNFRPV